MKNKQVYFSETPTMNEIAEDCLGIILEFLRISEIVNLRCVNRRFLLLIEKKYEQAPIPYEIGDGITLPNGICINSSFRICECGYKCGYECECGCESAYRCKENGCDCSCQQYCEHDEQNRSECYCDCSGNCDCKENCECDYLCEGNTHELEDIISSFDNRLDAISNYLEKEGGEESIFFWIKDGRFYIFHRNFNDSFPNKFKTDKRKDNKISILKLMYDILKVLKNEK